MKLKNRNRKRIELNNNKLSRNIPSMTKCFTSVWNYTKYINTYTFFFAQEAFLFILLQLSQLDKAVFF